MSDWFDAASSLDVLPAFFQQRDHVLAVPNLLKAVLGDLGAQFCVGEAFVVGFSGWSFFFGDSGGGSFVGAFWGGFGGFLGCSGDRRNVSGLWGVGDQGLR